MVVEHTSARDLVRIPAETEHVPGSRMGFLQPGRRARVESLLHGLLISSANDAATALAVHVAGSERRFVAMMNRRAANYGLACTRFVSAHGLSARNRSCPADVAELAVRAMEVPRIAAIVRKRSTRVRIGRIGRRWLATTNPLLIDGYPGVLGLKTGWTRQAGRCLIAAVRQGKRRRAVVLLHARDPGRAARRLFQATARLQRDASGAAAPASGRANAVPESGASR